MRNLIITLTLIFTQFSAWGSHIAAARVYTEPITGNQYKLVLEVYRDCSGVITGNAQSVTAVSGGSAQTYLLPMHSTSAFMDSCGLQTICSSPGGYYLGLEKIIYMDTVSILAPTTFSYANCCLNSSILNLTNPVGHSNYVECYIDPQGGSNTPVEVNNYEQLMHFSFLDSTTHDLNIYEQEGDSVVVSATTLMDGTNANPANYAAGYSASNPFGNNLYYNVSTDGIIDMVRFYVGQYALAYKVEAYRNGTLNWSQLFSALQIQISNITGTVYPPPTVDLVDALSGSTQNSQAPIHVVEGVQYKYLVETSTTNPSGVVTNTYNYLPNGMVVLQGTGSLDTLVWTPSSAQVNTYEVLSLKVTDNQCGIEEEKFHFKVLPAAVTDSVWPGDVDWNLHVDIADPVLIGVAYGITGSTRTNASNNWVAQASPDWTTSFVSGINHKHADCNGDGVIDSSDLIAINTNWGYTHNKNESYKTTSTVPIQSTSSGNYNSHFTFTLGSSSAVAKDIYAVSLELEIYNRDGSLYKNWTQAPFSIDVSSSWLDTDLLPFYKITGQQSIHLALTKKNQQANTGSGQLFTLSLDTSMSSEYSEVRIKNAITYDLEGNPMDTLAGHSAIYDLTPIAGYEYGELSLYPNPNQNNEIYLEIPSEIQGISHLELYNSLGQQVYSTELNLSPGTTEFQLPELSPATYLLRLIHEDSTWQTMYQKM